ncbi:MAG TPA: hypothetical protein VMJ32_15795 [Pirellulales bacterium]|nr:hypothetical protein [Pirellulales bacterium]
MPTSAEDAQRVFLLFNYGVLFGADVIKWAEELVANADSPSNTLLELAWTKPDNTADIISHLNALTHGVDICEAFKRVLGVLYGYVKTHPMDAERISQRLLGTLVTLRNEKNAREFYFLYGIDDDFEHANHGRYFERAAVLEDFLGELQKFAE